MSTTVYLLTSGEHGNETDEWQLIAIYSNKEATNQALSAYQRPRKAQDGTTYRLSAQIEPWAMHNSISPIHKARL